MFRDKKIPPKQSAGIKKPMSKEDAIKQMIEKNPEEAAKLLREILKGK